MTVAEVPGASLKRRLKKSYSFRESKCRDVAKCMVCEDGKGGRSRSEGVTYEVSCIST